MAETSTPFDGGPYMEEADWSSLWSGTLTDGVFDRGAATISGHQQNLELYTDNDGRQVKVSPGTAHAHGKFYRNTDTIVLPIAANATSDPRSDRVVIRVNESTTTQGGVPGKSARCVVSQGVAQFGGALPALNTGANGLWDVPLGWVSVGTNENSFTSDKIHVTRAWAGTESRWNDYTLNGYAFDQNDNDLGWLGFQFDADAGNSARYSVNGNTCHVSVTQLMHPTVGSGYSWALGLPIPARIQGATGTALVQNVLGVAIVVPDSLLVGYSGTKLQAVSLRKHDISNITSPSGPTYEHFDIAYEIADGY